MTSHSQMHLAASKEKSNVRFYKTKNTTRPRN